MEGQSALSKFKDVITMMLWKEILHCNQANILATNMKTAVVQEVLSTVEKLHKAT